MAAGDSVAGGVAGCVAGCAAATALVSTSSYGQSRRMAVGIDQNRLSLLLAVLEKRAGLHLAAGREVGEARNRCQ